MRNMKFYLLHKGRVQVEVIRIFDGGSDAIVSRWNSGAPCAPTWARAVERMAMRGYLPRAKFESRHPAERQMRRDTRRQKSIGAA